MAAGSSDGITVTLCATKDHDGKSCFKHRRDLANSWEAIAGKE